MRGDVAHVHAVVAAASGDGHSRIEDTRPALALSVRRELVLGEGGFVGVLSDQ